MNTLRWLRLCALGALAGSAAAAVDHHLGPGAGAFCGPAGGACRAVLEHVSLAPLTPVLPVVGLVGFSAVFWGSTATGAGVRRAACYGGVIAGGAGAALLAAQLWLTSEVCRVCAVTDGSAVALGIASLMALRHMPRRPSSWPLSAWLSLFVLALGVPPVYALSRPDTAPPFVRRHWEPDKVNVVEISDFQCPFCRLLHGDLQAALEPYADELNFVRLVYPLSGHNRAGWAARAYLCAEAQGRGEVMAHALFERDLAGLDAHELARNLRIDPGTLARCMEDPKTRKRVVETKRTVDAAGFSGLPTVYVGHEKLLGYRAEEGVGAYVEALSRAERGERPPYRPLPWIALGALLLVLVTVSSRGTASRARTRA